MDIEALAKEEAERLVGEDTLDEPFWAMPLTKDARADWLTGLLAAFGRRLLTCHLPAGPVSEERLEEIRSVHRPPLATAITRVENVRDLLTHIDHLTALLRDCSADGLMAVRQAGYEAGWRDGAAAQQAKDRADALVSIANTTNSEDYPEAVWTALSKGTVEPPGADSDPQG